MAAGERALGAQAFEEDVGHFWGLLETRPYMRARAGLAASLWTAGDEVEAVEHYQDMLRLNPGDNQGHRYVLLGCLLQMGVAPWKPTAYRAETSPSTLRLAPLAQGRPRDRPTQ